MTEGFVVGDIDAALVGQDAHIDLPIRQVQAEGEGDVFIHGLKGLEDKGVACGG